MFIGLVLALHWVAADPVDSLIQSELTARHIPGLNLLITKDDKVIKRQAYGLSDLEQNLKMTTEHVGESGSIGKSFTATVIMKLVEDGKLSVEDTLGTRLPHCPDLWKNITLRQCLNHMTGIPDYALIEGLGLVEEWTYDHWLELMAKQPLDFPTGKTFAYSNSNYLILGKVAEAVAGEPILAQTQEVVFDKAGMKHSYVADKMTIIPHRMHGYLNLPEGVRNGLFIAPGYGDGSFINSVDDLVAYERALREGRLVKPESVQLMQSSAVLPTGRKTGYGFGWFVRKVSDQVVFSHGGNTGGFFASIMRVPGSHITIALEGNLHDQGGDGLALRIAQLYDETLKPKVYAPKPDPHPAKTKELTAFLQSLGKAAPTQSMMDPEMSARLNTSRGRMVMGSFARYANADNLVFLDEHPDAPDTVTTYEMTLEGKTWILTFTLNSEGKVFSVGQREK